MKRNVRLYGCAAWLNNSVRDQQSKAAVLVQNVVRLGVGGLRLGIVTHFVDREKLTGRFDPVLLVRKIIQCHEVDALAQGVGINRSGEADADPWLKLEAIEPIELRDLLAAARLGVAIGRR